MRETAIARGRNTIIAIVGACLLMEFLQFLIDAWIGIPFSSGDVVRPSIICALAFFMYKGRDWARLAFLLWAMAGTFLDVYTLYLMITQSFNMFFIGLGLVLTALYGTITFVLMLSGDVSEFIGSRGPKR